MELCVNFWQVSTMSSTVARLALKNKQLPLPDCTSAVFGSETDCLGGTNEVGNAMNDPERSGAAAQCRPSQVIAMHTDSIGPKKKNRDRIPRNPQSFSYSPVQTEVIAGLSGVHCNHCQGTKRCGWVKLFATTAFWRDAIFLCFLGKMR